MRKIFTRLLVVLFVLSFSSVLNAQIESGKIYNIVNVGNSGYSLAAVSTTTNSIVTTDVTDYSQLWYVDAGTADGSYKVRNLSNGLYLQSAGTSQKWGLSSIAADLYYVTAGSDNTLSASNNSNGYDNMHYGANEGYVVGWVASASASQWQFNEVSMEDAVLQANWDEIDALADSVSNCATYQGLLDNIFSDKSCTTFNSGYSYSTTETNYSSLPYGLKKMVTKIYSNDWKEDNADNTKEGWDHSYAKRFRLQMYEPYSIAGDITSWLRMNTHANNDNPTGVYVNDRGLIYVMVEGEIKDGATLRLIDAGHNHRIGDATTGGYELKSGLNVIPCYGAGGHLYVCYNVDTYNADGTDAATRFPENRRLSNYPPLKIHIEGGAINGFYNAQGDFLAGKTYDGVTYNEDLWKTITNYSVDCDADWEYLETRANLNVLPILAHRQILLFQLNDWGSDPGMRTLLPDQVTVPSTAYSRTGSWDEYNMRLDPTSCKINIMMEAWDRIMYSEHATLGLVSQSTMDKMNEMYPRWNSDGSTGDIYTYDEAGADGKTYTEFCGVDYSEHFNHHGVGLGTESGYMSAGGQHCNYHINTFGSIVGEIASNAGSLWGPAHEIGHQHQGVFNIRGGTEVTNNVFSNAAVWYMGMATSRVNGTQGCLSNVLAEYNAGKPFIDYDIWAMTQLFYKLWLYYHLAGKNTQFYPRFFEMLRVDPLNAMGGTATGTDSMLKIYEKMCEAAGEDLTEFFRIHGFFVLLDNYEKGDYGTTYFTQTQEEVDAAIKRVKDKGYEENLAVILINDGTTESSVAHDGTTKRTLWDAASAEFGAVGEFIDGETSITTAYTASVSADGTVTMSGGEGGAGFLVLDEEGKVVSFSNKSTFEPSEEAAYLLVTGKATVFAVDAESNTTKAKVDLTALQKELLGALIAKADALPIDNGSYTQIGFYIKDAAADLTAALTDAKTVLESGAGYAAAYEVLYAAYSELMDAADVTVPFDALLTYTLTNYAYPTRTMTVNGTTVTAAEGVDNAADAAKWQFVSTNTSGVYNVKNMTGVYCPAISTSTSMTVTDEPAENATYVLQDLGYGLWAISLTPTADNTSFHSAANDSYNIVGWGAGSDASKWYLTAVEANETTKNTAELQVLIAKTEALKNLVGTVALTGKVGLQADNSDANYYITSNATESGHEPKLLVDNNTETYFHTNWSSGIATAGEDHYLQIDFGDAPVEEFTFNYTNLPTTAWNVDAAKTIEVQGANTIDNFTTITTLTSSDSNPLPTAKGGTYSSATLGATGTAYRYLRFTVTNATGGTHHGYYYFGMAELSITRSAAYIVVNDEYTNYVTDATLLAAAEEIVTAQTALDAGTDISAAYTALESDYKALETEYLNAIEAKRTELQSLIDKTAALVEQTADEFVFEEIEGNITLTTNAGDSGYLYCNATIAEGSLGNLLKDDETFIHTQWSGTSADGDYHYLRVDMGEDAKIDRFRFTYTTASRSDADMPGTIVVEGATEIDDDNSTKDTSYFTEITTLTHDASGLPQATNANTTFKSEILGTAGTYYRYLRFKVTAITRTSGDVADDNGYPYFTMAKFGLTKIVSVPTDATVNEAYKTSSVTGDLIIATYNENVDAATLKDITNSFKLLQAQIDELQAAYDALYDASITPAEADKTELEALIEATTLLKNDLYEMAVTSYNTEEVKLSATEGEAGWLYCNAVESHSIWTDDHTGVPALLDENTESWLHTMYSNYDSEDGLDHYLRVDLGDGNATDYIEFGYKGRSGHEGKSPKILLIQATNDLTDGGVWTDIATLNPEQASASTETKTGCLGNGNTYRYWRFMVKENHFNNASGYGHPYFCITEFNVYKCTDVVIESQLKYTPTIYIYTTSELVTEVEDAITAATTVKEKADATQTDVDTEVEALKAVYDKLAEALKYAEVPVAITTDINSPKLYVIYSQRGDTSADGVWTLSSTKCWQYNFANNNITISAGYTTDNLYQLWYFTYDSESEKYGIVPVMTPGYSIGANDFSAGASKISAINPDEVDGYVTSWALSLSATTPTNGVYYNFKPDGNNTFLSNYAGGSNPLGFYGTEDEGSRVYFESVDVENFAFKRLSKLNEVIGTLGIVPAASEIVGEYTIESATGYSAAVEKATSMVEGGTSTDAEYNAQFVALYQSYENLAINLPVPGTLYKLRSKYVTDHYVFVNDDRVARYSNNHIGDDNIDADAIWVFEGTENGSLKLKNLQTGCYVPSLPSGEFSLVPESENAGAMTLHPYGVGDGAVQIQGGSSYYFHFNSGSGGDQKLIGWEAGAIGGGNPVYIEEVNMEEAVNKISHSITLAPNTTGDDTTTGYSTLNLGYPVTVPEGVTAYIITNSAIVENIIELYLYAKSGNTIPANTPVILIGSTGTSAGREFKFNTTATTVESVTNLLGGTNYTTYESCYDENGKNAYNIYMLTRSGGIVALRWAYENYQRNDDGTYSKHADAKSDDGGYVKCSANKVYLKLGGTVASASSLSATYYFSLFEGTTDIDKIEGEENLLDGTIYDLQGRKIDEVKTPGFYIVNGKKMFINSELLK